MYDIYPNEIISNRGYAIVGVNDMNIMSKLYLMNESFFRCSIITANIFDGNCYDTQSKTQYATNSLFVSAFDLRVGIKAESRKTKRKRRITRHLGSSGGEANPEISPTHPPSEYGSDTTMISDIWNDPTHSPPQGGRVRVLRGTINASRQHHRRTRRTSGRSARRTPGTGRRSRVLVANRRS